MRCDTHLRRTLRKWGIRNSRKWGLEFRRITHAVTLTAVLSALNAPTLPDTAKVLSIVYGTTESLGRHITISRFTDTTPFAVPTTPFASVSVTVTGTLSVSVTRERVASIGVISKLDTVVSPDDKIWTKLYGAVRPGVIPDKATVSSTPANLAMQPS